jgi:hypothetical protein
MSPADEAVITKHYEKKGWGKPLEITAFERVPGMYEAVFADGGEYGVVLHGKLLDGKGLKAAGAYMREVKLLAHQPTAHDLTTLLEIFGALPPIPAGSYATPDGFYNLDKHPSLRPKLELAPGGGTLVLHYIVRPSGGPVANPTVRTVMRWTLAIPADYKLAWREEETTFDIGPP